ncbi:MAG: hypothetical protein Q9159_005854 [Coniocarpon cinnabarinum]
MALPALRAGILLTTAAAATGTLLYEHHEPFRHWADDVSGRASAAWVGLKEEIRELRDDIENHASRRREAPMGSRAGQWEGVGAGPWRRGRRRRSDGSRSGECNRRDERQGWDEAEVKRATGVEGNEGLRRRRSLHETSLDPEKIAREAMASEAVLEHESEGQGDSETHALRSPSSTETLRSAQGQFLDAAREHAILTPTTSASSTSTIDADDASMSVVSAPSEESIDEDVVMTPTESDAGVWTPHSGMMTPTSSTGGEFVDFEEVEEGDEARSQTAGREDAVSEGSSEWSDVEEEATKQ